MANGLFNLKQVVQAVQQGGWPAQKTPAVEYLVVAGGGGGGGYYGAGGGAGGLLQGIDPVPNGQTLLVTVGAGGTGTSNGYGNNGSNSVFGSVIALGGGGGAGGSTSSAKNGNAGGSGGGGQGFGSTTPGAGGANNFGQGNAGGAAVGSGGGCGGGAGTAGIASLGTAGRGGDGVSSVISGTVTAYAGGGAGAGIANSLGGVGGGGNANTAGTANTGGGAGGDDAKSGGSGIVIVSYPDVYAAPTATTGSPTVSTSGSGSLSFNGSSQFVGYANNAALQLTGDFTIEGWFYISASTAQNHVVISKWNGSSQGYLIYYQPGTNASFGFQNTAVSIVSSSTYPIGQFYHVAVTRSGNNYVLYVNGTSAGTATSATTATDSGTGLEVGRNNQNSANNLLGYASNVRIVKGTAVYTGNFTPSTTPLTAISNTSLLLNTVSGAPYADGSTNSFATTTATSSVGPWNALSPFTVTGYKNRVYTWTSSGSITF